jgi:hypothetical protein
MMNWELSLEPEAVPSGLDFNALTENIEAEVVKITSMSAGSSFKKNTLPPPAGSQGHDLVVQWLLHFAEQAQMVQVYAKAFVFSVNELLQSAKSSTKRTDQLPSKNPEKDDSPSFAARLTILGKDVILPTTVAAINTFLSDIGLK